MKKLFNIANQGYRSMVLFYGQLDYDINLFERYFRHDIVYLYMLSKREQYGQMYPFDSNIQHKSNFPNIFLINCDNEYNIYHPVACQPHRLTYWLKYLILLIVGHKKKVSIRYILDTFSSYDDHAVRLCLGSLSTSNEYNCLKLWFPGRIFSKKHLEESTKLSLNKRGKFLIEDYYCMGLDCLQFYVDDWLLPRGKSDYFDESFPFIESFSFSYLLDANGKEYKKNKDKILPIKAKQCLFFLGILKSAQKYEMNEYNQSWIIVMNTMGSIKEDFLLNNNQTYSFLQDRIINEVKTIMGDKGEDIEKVLKIYKDNLNKSVQFDQFFEKIASERIMN